MLERVTMGSMVLVIALGVAAPASADSTTKPAREAQAGDGARATTNRPGHAPGPSG